MKIKRSGSQPSSKGPAEYFTGTVRIEPLFEAREYFVAGDRRIDREAAGEAASDRAITSQPADVRGASVTFEPGARTAWHTHPLGQTLIVTSGPWVDAALGRSDRAIVTVSAWRERHDTSRANFPLRGRHPRPLARAISTKSLTAPDAIAIGPKAHRMRRSLR